MVVTAYALLSICNHHVDFGWSVTVKGASYNGGCHGLVPNAPRASTHGVTSCRNFSYIKSLHVLSGKAANIDLSIFVCNIRFCCYGCSGIASIRHWVI